MAATSTEGSCRALGGGHGEAPLPLGAHGVRRTTLDDQASKKVVENQEHFLINCESEVLMGFTSSPLEGHMGSSIQAEVCLKIREPEQPVPPLPTWL